MPQRIICKHCGTILYDGADLKPPDEVAQKLDGKCPKCGRKLSFIPIDVDVRPAKQP
jgi:RNase P subunit RPR2